MVIEYSLELRVENKSVFIVSLMSVHKVEVMGVGYEVCVYIFALTGVNHSLQP